MDELIYLDNNASTPTDDRVIETMLPFFREHYANASATHAAGVYVAKQVENARCAIAGYLNCNPQELIFTSGATEAINLAIRGVCMGNTTGRKKILAAATEHKAVLDTCYAMQAFGYTVQIIPVDSEGLIIREELEKMMDSETLLCCIMQVNNETGVIQDIGGLAPIVNKYGSLFFCDGTQAIGKLPVDLQTLQADFFCCSGHKFYGPKGIGMLYIKEQNRQKLFAVSTGGGQEFQLRSGTLNVPGIIGIGTAFSIVSKELPEWTVRIGALRDELEKSLLALGGIKVNGSVRHRVYNTSNLQIRDYPSDVLIGRLKNIAVSNGSACTSGLIEPSHVLTAMGLSHDEANSSLRLALGKNQYKSEVIRSYKSVRQIIIND